MRLAIRESDKKRSLIYNKENIKKMGLNGDLPLVLGNHSQNSIPSMVWLVSETVRIMTVMVSIQGFESPLMFAVLVEEVKENEAILEGIA